MVILEIGLKVSELGQASQFSPVPVLPALPYLPMVTLLSVPAMMNCVPVIVSTSPPDPLVGDILVMVGVVALL